MPSYEWRNTHTGEVTITDSPDKKPDKGEWVRVFSFGIGSVNGAGSSPARSSARRRTSKKSD